MEFDVVIIGGGVIGAALARELSRYEVSVLLLEKEADVAMGASRANSGIVHAGFDPSPGSNKARLNLQGNQMMEDLCRELEVPFQRIGSLVVGRDENDRAAMEKLLQKGIENKVDGLRIVDGDELSNIEPNLSREFQYALLASTAGIVCPYTLTISLAENAVLNGTNVLTGVKVTGIIENEGKLTGVTTDQGSISCRFVVNCAGVWSDQIAAWVEQGLFRIDPYRGEYCLLDKKVGRLVNHVIFPLPNEHTKGILVTPTVSGNVLLGPNRTLVGDREDNATTPEGLREVLDSARNMVPSIKERDVIASFAGIRAVASTGEFMIGPTRLPGFINAGGIQSPGLTAAPAIAKSLVDILHGEGLKLYEKTDYEPRLVKGFKYYKHSYEEAAKAIEDNPRFGEMVCRCETVSAGEIIAALNNPLGARTVDGIKRRTRAGMGRCQGGFCSHRVMGIIANELGVPVTEVTKDGIGTEIIFRRSSDKPPIA